MEKFYLKCGQGVLVALILAVISLFGAVPFMLCWNHAVPHVFELPAIGYWQAFAMLWVSRSLFPCRVLDGPNPKP